MREFHGYEPATILRQHVSHVLTFLETQRLAFEPGKMEYILSSHFENITNIHLYI